MSWLCACATAASDVEEQPHARLDSEPRVGGVAIDALALDVFEHQIRLAAGRDAGIDELRDVRVRAASRAPPLAHEPLLRRSPEQRRVQQLHGGAAFVAAVAAAREPHRAHATLTERGFQCVRAYLHVERLPYLTQADKWCTVRAGAPGNARRG